MSRPLALASFALLLAACSSSPSSPSEIGEATRAARSAVISGKNSDASQDAVVLLIHYDPTKAMVGSCTGSLIAPNLVLTARHCVADTDESAACAADGTPIGAGVVRGNHKPETLYVFTGKDRPDFSSPKDIKPAGQGAQILDDGGKNLCNHDIALVVLQAPIDGASIIPLRLDADIQKNEAFTAVGWGVTDKSTEPNTRQQRAGVKVEAVGPDDNAMPPVPPNEFEVGEAICSGDSGGPAIASTGAIIGIVSRGGNAKQPSPNDPAANCVGAENFYTKLAPFKDFIMKGFDIVQADPWIEGGPDPRLLKPGSACGDASECRSNICVPDPDQKSATTCAADCSVDDCPDGQVCKTEGDVNVCRSPSSTNHASPTTTGGCSGAPVPPSSGLFAFALAAFGFAASRRRRPG